MVGQQRLAYRVRHESPHRPLEAELHLAFGRMDIDVDRNGYGRQVHSVDDKVVADLGRGPTELTATFIRAPRVTRVGAEVTVLATWRGDPVLVRQGRILAAAFHTELDDDTRLLEYFLSLAP